MHIDERFEYPLPILSADTKVITLRAVSGGECEGELVLKNNGGGVLSGSVASGASGLTFTPREFEGNMVRIRYNFTPGIFRPGDRIRANAVISSNGGEKTIPVTIDYLPPGIRTEDGAMIASLPEFADYCRDNPEMAGMLFSGAATFRRFLTDIGYGPLGAYDMLTEDPDRERALENFLCLSGLKSKSALSLPEDKFAIELKPGDTGLIYGSIPIERTGWGYLDAPVSGGRNVPWLSTQKIVKASDFGDGNAYALPFAVDPKEVKGPWEAERVIIGRESPLIAEIAVKRLPTLEAGLSREFYGTDDNGFLRVANHTGRDMTIEIVPSETFVKFAGMRYTIGERADIPFLVKFSALQSAQLALRGQPVAEAAIEVRAGAGAGHADTKRLKITAGEFK